MADKFKGFNDLGKQDQPANEQGFFVGDGQVTVAPKDKNEPLTNLISEANSLAVPAGTTTPNKKLVTFWKNKEGGTTPVYSIDDGPAIDIPADFSSEFLVALSKTDGFEVANKTNVTYQPPVKDSTKFVGSGQSLGNSASSKATAAEAKQVVVDSSKPTTKLQITFLGGNRMVVVFNHDHTVQDVRSHMEAVKPCGKPFELKTTYPQKTLDNLEITLKDAGLLNAAVVQSD